MMPVYHYISAGSTQAYCGRHADKYIATALIIDQTTCLQCLKRAVKLDVPGATTRLLNIKLRYQP